MKWKSELLVTQEVTDMRCPRCLSPMVYQKFYGSQEYFWGWRCVFCGEIIDPMILENRLLDQEAPRLRERRR